MWNVAASSTVTGAVSGAAKRAAGRRVLHGIGLVSAVSAAAVAVVIVIMNERECASARAQTKERFQLRLSATQQEVAAYLDEVVLWLRLVSADPELAHQSPTAHSHLQAIYEGNYRRHRLAEIYVIERYFDGTRRPFKTFEKGDELRGVEELHALEREQEEYAVHIEHIRRFAADPTLETLISMPVNLCVDASGIVVSVPWRAAEELLGIVAGMAPLTNLTEILQHGDRGQACVLVGADGTLLQNGRLSFDLETWLRDELRQHGPRAFFARVPQLFHAESRTGVWAPVNAPGGDPWYVALFYDEAEQLAAVGAPGRGSVWGIAAIVMLLGGAIAFLCRMTPALVTARHLAEARTHELLASEARFQTLVATMNEGLAVQDESGTLTYANHRLCDMLGFRPQDLIGRRADEIVFDQANRAILADQLQDRRRGQSRSYELVLADRQGRPVMVLVSPRGLWDADGSWRGSFAVVTDIRERKAAEDELRRSQRFLQMIVDQIPEAVLVIDRQNRVTLANRAAQNLPGGVPAGLRWFTCSATERDSAGGPKAAEGACLATQVAAKRIPVSVTHACADAAGNERLLELIAAPVCDESGQVTHIIGSGRDVTARVRAEAEARRRQAELAHVARLGTMGEMAAGLAHELNQPLVAIVNYLEACRARIQNGVLRPQILLDDLARAAAQAERAGGIIEHLRAFIRKGDTRVSRVDVNALVREAVELLSFELQYRHVGLQLRLTAGLPAVHAARIQIVQTITNLMQNGIEAMSELPQAARRLTIETTRTGDGLVEVAISDAGSGLPPETRERLFEPFYTTKPEGMGLGLSISRSIVEAHGGRLWACDRPGGGALFRFTLPADAGGAIDES